MLKLPKPQSGVRGDDPPPPIVNGGTYTNFDPDGIESIEETPIGPQGMKVDRKLFEKFEDVVKADAVIQSQVEQGNWSGAADYLTRMIFNKPEEYFNLEKLRKSLGLDRRLSVRELLEKVFGKLDRFKTKDELLDDEFEKFMLDLQIDDPEAITAIKYFFKAYVSDEEVRTIVDKKEFGKLHTNATMTASDYREVPKKWRQIIPEYVKDYVNLNRFMQ